MTAERVFDRTIEALPAIVAFTAGAFDRLGIDRTLLPGTDFAIEELFTNMVKYGGDGGGDVRIVLASIDGGVAVTLSQCGVEPFDVTAAPDADVGLPLHDRRPGGLGLHLLRRLVDDWQYDYVREKRQSRVRFRITTTGHAARAMQQH